MASCEVLEPRQNDDKQAPCLRGGLSLEWKEANYRRCQKRCSHPCSVHRDAPWPGYWQPFEFDVTGEWQPTKQEPEIRAELKGQAQLSATKSKLPSGHAEGDPHQQMPKLVNDRRYRNGKPS